MRRVESVRSKRWWTGVLGASLMGLTGAAAHAQSQTAVPDAPKPQALPNLNTITPTAPAVPARPPASQEPDAPSATVGANADAAAQKDNGGVVPTAGVPTLKNGQPVSSDVEIPASEVGLGPIGPGQASIVVNVNYVEVPFTVKDAKGRDVPGIVSREVRVYENGQRMFPLQRFSTDPSALSIALVIDQSVTQDTMEKINVALGALQGAFTPYDEVAVFTYNNGVTKRDDFSLATGARLAAVLEASKGSGREPLMGMDGPLSQTTNKNNMQVDPNTSPIRNQNGITFNVPREFHTLNDAVFEAAKSLSHAAKGRLRVVYVISDGKEYGSKIKQSEVIRYLQANKISVNATLVGDSSIPGLSFLDRIHLPLQMRGDILPRYAAATGGDYDAAFRPRAIEASFAHLTASIRTQYIVGYYSHEPIIDGKFRKIEVKVERPNLTIVAKDGYYPNPQDGPRPKPRMVPTAAPSPTPAAPSTAPQE